MIKRIVYMAMCWLLVACSGKHISEEELLRSINNTPMLYTVQCVAQTTVIERSSPAMNLLGQRTAIIPVQANVKAGIDLSQLKNIRISDKTVYITLPDPVIEIESTRILSDEIVTSVAPLRTEFSNDELSQIARKGTDAIRNDLGKYNLVEPAQEQAELVIASIVNRLGLEVVFEKRQQYENRELFNLTRP
ncbi:MAG: DUF4230 domain-containing protein [Prevotella sp.]|nr:DUF4230 domain-containing protein [Prevotella sp.]